VPGGTAEPAIDFRWEPKARGYYTVGFVGAPASDLADVQEVFQPLIWQEKRFPDRSYLTLAYRCTVPAALVTRGGQTVAVAADPKELPFQPLPTSDNSRFGVAVRNPAGQAQSMVFAPALGNAGSEMSPGDAFDFRLRLFVGPGGAADAFEQIARGLLRFSDFRRNADTTLNQTLDNMIAYGMSEWSRFREEMKGCAYDTDAPGTVKNVSSLNPLDMALVTDDPAVFERRAYPYVEYMLSREKFLFTLDEAQKIQSPSYTLRGPCAPVSELASLYVMFGRATRAFVDLALEEHGKPRTRNLDDVEPAERWDNALSLYRATGDAAYLARAKAGADEYIARRIDAPQTSFADPDAGRPFFWTSYAPKFAQLTELYEATGERRYLDAAHAAARRFAMFTWMLPVVPDEQVLVNEGGQAPVYWYLKGKGHAPMAAAEERVPAWRLSEIGLTAESSGTSTGHRAIFMANYAPWLARIGYYADDPFLRQVARHAVVGRYANFPGYHINTARTTAYEKPDYPLREHKALSVNSFHYNHCWPMMSMLLDYLVTEALVRSDRQIDFPSQFIEGYAYLQNKAYGGQVGRFYEHADAVLWMPRGLLTTESGQVNYIAARGEGGRLYLALMNEDDEAVTTTVSLNPDHVPAARGARLEGSLRGEDGSAEPVAVRDGTFRVTIPARGLRAVVVEGANVTPRFQQKVMGLRSDDAWQRGLVKFGPPDGRAMVLNLGPEARTVFAYLEDAKRDFASVEMRYTVAGQTRTLADEAFPWEFTIPLPDGATDFSFDLTASRPDGSRHAWEPVRLHK
jgi:hypothetical protein